jgi:hypothetical protein
LKVQLQQEEGSSATSKQNGAFEVGGNSEMKQNLFLNMTQGLDKSWSFGARITGRRNVPLPEMDNCHKGIVLIVV